VRRSKNRTFRILPELDAALLRAAERSGRSVSEEIEKRLTASFAAGSAADLDERFARFADEVRRSFASCPRLPW
jgi:hypothetical protein